MTDLTLKQNLERLKTELELKRQRYSEVILIARLADKRRQQAHIKTVFVLNELIATVENYMQESMND